MKNMKNNNNTEHARIFKDTPFFNVFVLLLLVWYIFLERHGYQCCLLTVLIIFEEREIGKDRQTDRQRIRTRTRKHFVPRIVSLAKLVLIKRAMQKKEG